jgi:3-oxoacyl-[acyl-carrier protein] reductase
MRFSKKTLIITGGSSGIGAATVKKFLTEGAKVIVWDVLMPDESQNADFSGEKPIYQKVDVTNRSQINSALLELKKLSIKVDILINNAGITADSQMVKWKDGEVVKEMTPEEFQKVVSINLTGVFNCAQAVVPIMIENKGGVILNAASVVGIYGNFGQTNYVATKSGVIGMTKVWAREYGRYGIRVNAVAPGFISTEMVHKMPENVINDMKTHTPLGRLGTPEDVANVYAFLASDEAAFIHGAVISVDGGIVIGT